MSTLPAPRSPNPESLAWRQSIEVLLRNTETLARAGYVHSINGSVVRARGVGAAVGELCELRIRVRGNAQAIKQDNMQANAQANTQASTQASTQIVGHAEVIGVQGADLILSSLVPTFSLSSKVQVIPLSRRLTVPAADSLLGRVLDGYGQAIDDLGPLGKVSTVPIDKAPPPAMQRQTITQPLITGIRAIDGLMTCGQGQRIAIFSPAGAGKSSLIGALARQCQADAVVVALVGERGREVGEFVREQLGAVGMRRAVVLASSSDRPAIERVKCAQAATAIAEQFRSQGKHVLLLVDSITRFARAQRELTLALGETATRDDLPSSALASLAPLIERAGTGTKGAISAFYTVLTEDDQAHDSIAEEVRSIVDGHIVLSRAMAEAGHYPAIDVSRSISRVMQRLVSPRHAELAQLLRSLLNKLESIELLIQVGEYRPGTDPLADRAVNLRLGIEGFLRQGFSATLSEALQDVPKRPGLDLIGIQAALEKLLSP